MGFDDGPRSRRMIRGTIARTGGLCMRYGLLSQLATLDCTSSRRSTVMRALPRATAVTTVYQRDSSSKRPRSSVAARAGRAKPRRKRPAPAVQFLIKEPVAHALCTPRFTRGKSAQKLFIHNHEKRSRPISANVLKTKGRQSRRKTGHFRECLVGASGFEPPTPRSRTECSTRLSHAPTRRR
jgi:hypothetical protein